MERSKFLCLIAGFGVALCAVLNTTPAYGEDHEPDSLASTTSKFEQYRTLFGVDCLDEKVTDNYGNGDEALYGTRNFRPILHGVAYRGGGNNYYHKTAKRENKNPLPTDGLQNLAALGFSAAVYLYEDNFDSAPRSIVEGLDTLHYYQISGNSVEEQDSLLSMIYEAIQYPETGPLYLHCWNGWHQSGYVSAIILRQFCGFSAEESLNYWVANTDGWNNGYKRIREAIVLFEPRDDYPLDASVVEDICPCKEVHQEIVERAAEKEDWIQANLNRSIQFDNNSVEIGPGQLTAIDDYVEFMQAYPFFQVRLEGHTSPKGNRKHNQALSEKRAQRVEEYMIAQGVDASRLSSVGFGEDRPQSTGRFKSANDENRRVEFVISAFDLDITFPINSAELPPETQADLIVIMQVMQSMSSSDFLIEGHTDDSGRESFNMHLSELRASAVKDYLVKVGMDDSRLEAKGLGSSQPIVSNTSDENRLKNRRIEIHFKSNGQE